MKNAWLSGVVCASISSTVLAGSPEELPKLSDSQLREVSGGQAVVQSNQGTTAVSAESGGSGSGTFNFAPAASNALNNQNSTSTANASASFGTMPFVGSVVGSSSFVKYGN